MIILHNNKKGNNNLIANLIAKKFNCTSATVDQNPPLYNHNIIIFVIPNVGDEELPQPMEDYLFNLKYTNKKYIICELGNYFGLENYCGCKKIAIKILDSLGWEKISDMSIDSLPKLDHNKLQKWLNELNL